MSSHCHMPNLETISYSGISHHTLKLTSSPESHDFYTKWGHVTGIKEKTVIVNHIIITRTIYNNCQDNSEAFS